MRRIGRRTTSRLERVHRIREHADRLAPERESWIERNRAFYDQDWAQMRLLVPPGHRVLEIGCGTGRLLAELAPAVGVGIDLSPEMVREGKELHPELELRVGDVEDPATFEDLPGPFDYIVLSDLVGYLDDCQAAFENLRALATPTTRVVVAHYSRAWGPALRFAQRVGRQMPTPAQNWLATEDIENLLELAGFETIKHSWRQLIPLGLGGVGPFVSRHLATLPAIRRVALRNYVVTRPAPEPMTDAPSISVIVPCRNEAGNIEPAVDRLARFAPDMEIIFVEGNSSDDTLAEAVRVRDAHPDRDIKVLQQPGKGKGDAVRTGFAAARGDLLMIMDADLTTPPEEMPRFYELLASRRGELVMGSRLVYPMEEQAMRALNLLGNWLFAFLFSWLLGQRVTDTLCGTKALPREAYERIERTRRVEWGDFDPFGDFDLIFGAARHSLKIVEIPVHYAARTYGETQISRFRHGLMLFRMVLFAYRRLKSV